MSRVAHSSIRLRKLLSSEHTKAHSLFIQPVGHSKSKASKKGHDLVLANVYCDDPEKSDAVRDALKQSGENKANLVVRVWGFFACIAGI